MQETLQQREDAMRAILHKIQNKIDFETFTFEEQRIAKECYDAGFFEGIVMLEMVSGRIVAEYRHEPRITHKGMGFLYPATPEEIAKVEVSMSDVEHELQAEKERNDRAAEEADRKKDHRFQILTALLSGLAGSLLTLLVEHLSQIMSFMTKLLHQ